MNKNQKGLAPIIIVLIVVALLAGGILVWQYFGMPKEEVSKEEVREEKKVRAPVPVDETADWKINEELLNKQLGFHGHDIEELRKKGLEDPVRDLKADLIKHPELIPYEGVLGGTMGFYHEDKIWVLTKKWVLAYFGDGHIGGYMLLEYTVSDDGEISWKVIDSHLD